MKNNKLNPVDKYILSGALELWVEAFNQERTNNKGISLFGEHYAEVMAQEIKRKLNIREEDEPGNV